MVALVMIGATLTSSITKYALRKFLAALSGNCTLSSEKHPIEASIGSKHVESERCQANYGYCSHFQVPPGTTVLNESFHRHSEQKGMMFMRFGIMCLTKELKRRSGNADTVSAKYGTTKKRGLSW